MYTEDNLDPSKLSGVIDEVLTQLSGHDCETEEYGKIVDHLTKLYKVKEIDINLKLKVVDTFAKKQDLENQMELKKTESEANFSLKFTESDAKIEELKASCNVKDADAAAKRHEIEKPDSISKDTLAIIGANLAGIALILGYERLNIITSKAIGFVNKLR
jgi:hypothetical protein